MLDDILKQIKQIQPTYKATLPLSKKEVEYYPFKIKDQKIISIIAQEKNIGIILKNLCILLKNCSNLTNIEDLYLPDLEFLFLQIRSKSVEEEIKLKIDKTPPVYGTLNVNEIQFKDGKLNDTIITYSGAILEVQQPKVKDYFDIEKIDDNIFVKKVIKSLSINKFRYDLTLLKNEELTKIIEELCTKDNKKILNFIKESPKLFYILDTGEEKIKLEGLLRFFT